MTGQGDQSVRRLDPAEVGKELAATALVMLALTIGLVGFKMEDISGGTTLVTRFGAVAAVIVLAILGRYALILMRHGRPGLVAVGATPLGIVFLVAMIGQIVLEQGDWLAIFLPFSEPVVNWLVVIVTFVFAGRGVWAYRHATSTLTAAEREAAADRFGAKVQQIARVLGPVLLIAALLFPLLTIWIDPKVMRHPLDIAVLVFTYIMLGWGLNIVVGLAGLLDLGYVAFYAVGAYSYALLAQHFGLGFWVCLPFAGVMAATAGLVLGFPVLRLRGDYLAIVTLGFGEMIRVILLNWYDFTNGPDGLSGIPRPTFFGLPLTRATADSGETFHTFFNIAYSPVDKIIYLYYVIIGLALITNLFTLRIRRLPVGRAWEALREDETACRALGINPRNTKLTAFAIGAMFGGFGGSFFAARQTFISPESFTFIESAVILAIVVLGGFGSQIGVVFAAILLIGLPEFFRDLHQYRMLAFGAAMVLIMVWRPAGLLAHREPTIKLSAQPPAEETPS